LPNTKTSPRGIAASRASACVIALDADERSTLDLREEARLVGALDDRLVLLHPIAARS